MGETTDDDDDDDDIYYDEVCVVCLSVTKNEHFLKLPPSAPKVSWEPPCRHQKSSLTQEGQ